MSACSELIHLLGQEGAFLVPETFVVVDTNLKKESCIHAAPEEQQKVV